MSRWKAAAIHLSISALIGLLVASLLFLVWYPPPYFRGAGASELIVVLLAVDLTLGPLLTLVVFKAGKKGLAFDLAAIATLQLGALLYGLLVIAQARPVFIVAAIDRFNVVAAKDLGDADLRQASSPRFASRSWTGPRLVAVQRPADSAARSDLLFSGLAGKDIEKFPQYYVDYSVAAPALLARAKPLADLRQSHPGSAEAIDRWLARRQRSADATRWLPIEARSHSLTMLLDGHTGAVLDALPIDPW